MAMTKIHHTATVILVEIWNFSRTQFKPNRTLAKNNRPIGREVSLPGRDSNDQA